MDISNNQTGLSLWRLSKDFTLVFYKPKYIMWNARLDQAGIKISRRNINNLRYADETNLLAESKELKRLLMKVKKWKKLV